MTRSLTFAGRAGIPRPAAAAFAAAAALALLAPDQARACGYDGAPSLRVDRQQVATNRATPTSADRQVWAPFILPGALRASRSHSFAEHWRRSPLPAGAMATPWRWTFSDGGVARGMQVQHTFRRPGVYKVLVQAYDKPHHYWYIFDAAQLRVTGG